MEILIVIIAAVIGAVLGSFACCQAWRLRYRLQKKKDLGERSVCLKCHKQLKWFDNIPIVSWVMLKGRCRYCGKKIGAAEILAEVGGAVAAIILALLYVAPLVYNEFSPLVVVLQLCLVVVAAAMLTGLIVLAVYDGEWGQMPSRLLYLCAAAGAVILALREVTDAVSGSFAVADLWSAAGAILIMAGPCLVFYKVSHEKWMGGGDWWLALALAFLIGDWWLALWAMTVSCLLAAILSTPAATKGNHRLHFGPYLIVGSFAVLACQFLLLEMLPSAIF